MALVVPSRSIASSNRSWQVTRFNLSAVGILMFRQATKVHSFQSRSAFPC